MRTTVRQPRTWLIIALLAALAVAVAAVVLTRPNPAADFWTAYTALYPGTPASERAEFVATAEHLCEAGAPESWWLAWDNGNPARRDLWNISITHLCPEWADQIKE